MDTESKGLFDTLKPICVPLLKNSRLTPETIPNAANLLTDLLQVLKPISTPRLALPEGLIHYIFFPISGIIRQNDSTTIPDHIMERILDIITILLQSWWWIIEPAMRRTLVNFSSRCLPSGDRSVNGTENQRHEETQLAAVRCLWEILRDHSLDDGTPEEDKIIAAQKILEAKAISPPQLVFILILGIGDQVCTRQGAIRIIGTLDDYAEISSTPTTSSGPPGVVQRTPSWLSATSIQLHNALNVIIPPLVDHPTPAALEGLIDFCSVVLSAASEALQRSQTLLLLPLLILMLHSLPSIADLSRRRMTDILANPSSNAPVLDSLKKAISSTISGLPQLLLSNQNERLANGVKILTAVAVLSLHGVDGISKSISHVLGPNGGIEKWGWNLLEGLELGTPNVFYTTPDADVFLLQSGPSDNITFPYFHMKHVPDSGAQATVANFFRSWGAAAGDEALFSVEWLVSYASKGSNTTEVSALWCASRLLEGICGQTLGETNQKKRIESYSTRLKQHARWLSKLISSLWEQDHETEDENIGGHARHEERDGNQLVEHVKGFQQIQKLLDLGKKAKPSNQAALREQQRVLYRALSLHLLALSSSILENRFSAMLLQALYPILHSFVSTDSFLSATAQSTLLHVTQASGYASPANLLLSNFDYALG
ncbi:hypothetical protein FRC14_007760, partial [Serendipita sp. 396]